MRECRLVLSHFESGGVTVDQLKNATAKKCDPRMLCLKCYKMHKAILVMYTYDWSLKCLLAFKSGSTVSDILSEDHIMVYHETVIFCYKTPIIGINVFIPEIIKSKEFTKEG